MIRLKLRNEEGTWNGKFYGTDKNEIYFNDNKITLTEEEMLSIREQQIEKHEDEDILDYKAANRKTAQIMNYLKELSDMSKDKEELKEHFTVLQREMQKLFIEK